MRHELKITPNHFEDIIQNNKSFEVREARDRYFAVNDSVLLREYDWRTPENPEYTGRQLDIIITFVTTYAQQKGYVVFGFNVLNSSIY